MQQARLSRIRGCCPKWPTTPTHGGSPETQLDELTEQLERQQDQRDLMRHWVDELNEFAPEEGEFGALIEQRRRGETKAYCALRCNAETIIGSDRGMLGHERAALDRASNPN